MKRVGIIGVAFTFTFVAGCALSETEEDLVETSSIESDVTILPEEGLWFYDEQPPITTNCNAQVPDAVSGTFFQDQITATSFRVFPRDGTSAFLCNVSESSFTCEARNGGSFAVSSTATLTHTITVKGAFTDTRHSVGK